MMYFLCREFCHTDCDASFLNILDVFLMCGSTQKTFQIWTNHKGDGFKLARSGSFPPNVGAVSFADMGL